VFLPVTIKIYGRALVAAAPLAAGSVVGPSDLIQAEVDLAEDPSSAVSDEQLAVGRTLARAVNAGQSLRQMHLKPRLWFAAGETVKVLALGTGFSAAGEGQALTPGVEGQPARVRTESGRVLTGLPVGERRMEMAL
jgi:flagella basal body P-ring formation protein FlgA